LYISRVRASASDFSAFVQKQTRERANDGEKTLAFSFTRTVTWTNTTHTRFVYFLLVRAGQG